MAALLVRNLDEKFVRRLKAQAERHGRSLQAEAKQILTGGLKMTMAEALKCSEYWHKRLAGRKFSDSTDLIREDRDR